ncbi:Riboflavin biosynthesis protein RibD [Gracilariopsis chorda]|uniref:Riboflavin biosynthesis protein RibD n=1 Tax=Gracilariopsis chorda TaxID=448386 RepID=A0A2V3IHN7_9FLOR|nr:Riboflavin biosynthesis protein RibD [Gracilariopsis chorda]|eukprot:PXF41625.1 Riboflavin biosynthesis protein RibD [Gracilariopsis chorda]
MTSSIAAFVRAIPPPTASKTASATHPLRPRPRRRPLVTACAQTDAKHMQRAVELAKKAVGQTRPNPPVGCVLTTPEGRVIGEGYHLRAGFNHAEVNALQDAKNRHEQLAGSTAYVSLEPCNHYGRTPPCSAALLEAGVKRVVVGMIDPDPRTAGNGVKTLRQAGVSVHVGVQSSLCTQLNEGFVHRVRHKRPFGILKYAMTLDGKIAATDGTSKWVTGPASRQCVQHIRRSVDAIIVGGQTLRKDDPRLTVRDGRQLDADGRPLLSPLRVVMTKTFRLPTEARLWNHLEHTPTIVLADASHGNPAVANELIARGVTVEQVPGLSPDDVMDYLYHKDCINVLWECGGNLASQAVRSGAVQKLCAFIAPKLVGGLHAPTPLADPPVAHGMSGAVLLHNHSCQVFENGDVLISAYVKDTE